MKTIYTVYQLNEKVNKLGNPYIGYSQDLITRARNWKSDLKLNYKPKLIPLYFSTEEEDAFNWEEAKRIELGWGVERCTFEQLKKMRQAAQIANKKNYTLKVYRKSILTESQKLQIGKLYNTIDGVTGKKWDRESLAENYNVTKGTIYNILKKQNFEFKHISGKCFTVSKKQYDEIKNLYNTKDELGRKYTLTYLSKKYNVSSGVINNIILNKYTYFKR
jgi:hypothetical protein